MKTLQYSSGRIAKGLSAFVVASLAVLIRTALAHAVTIDMVTVGNPGNAADTTGYGAVNYEYQIGKYDVTIGQYTDFLNAVAKTNDRGLWNAEMSSDQRIRGIAQSGSEGSFVYAVVGPNGFKPAGATSAANRPITFVSWFDAARFANWMANGKPTGAAGSTTTDNGAYAPRHRDKWQRPG
jgi:sulfatase modifying factor 1